MLGAYFFVIIFFLLFISFHTIIYLNTKKKKVIFIPLFFVLLTIIFMFGCFVCRIDLGKSFVIVLVLCLISIKTIEDFMNVVFIWLVAEIVVCFVACSWIIKKKDENELEIENDKYILR